MRIIAFYLPQFHEIPENNEWWGEGFTEWVNIRKAKPLFYNHNQPRVPLDNNYYNLLNEDTMKWQVKLAKEYGLGGFCFYHYWFDGHLLLEKPVENYLNNKELDLPFCICWANEHWTNAWVSKENKVLIEQKYGNKEDWKVHFYYLLPFIKDSRYIKNNGKPLIIIYRPEIIDCLNEMLDYWQELAIENGLPGIDFAYQHVAFDLEKNKDDSRFAYNIEYQPTYATAFKYQNKWKVLKKFKRNIAKYLESNFKIDIRYIRPGGLQKYDYDEIWNYILSMKPQSHKSIPGAFVDWDNTPRRSVNGSVYLGTTPEKFKKYLTKQIARTKDIYNTDMIFLFSWNEWAEGGYLEPDEKNEYAYLQAMRQALIDNGEYPNNISH